MLLSVLLIALVLQGTLVLPQQNPMLAKYTQAFSKAQIVPNVLESFNLTALLDVVYMDPATKQPLHVPPGVHLMTERECHSCPWLEEME